ncbi:Pycsar system effector family protein [Mucilaginibacter aquariorum]|uniref:DUF5706 domain-containing protein n=1 Tax=Mucilaginibacter aquariorum TaxID=2967225 RepID=A0ABT1T715_9SPHI|nr:Pycsar system effector family protein [Mucilaginibacter aquariorum]MCQ6960405.1 DUF5706 domain-containing protein [Mucilaginibacter aquariorum]
MEKERLQFNTQRFDTYYDSVNNKCAVFLALSTFIVGGLATAYSPIINAVNCGRCIHLLMSSLIGIGVIIMIIVIRASTPYLDSKKKSLLYFGCIAAMDRETFISKSKGSSGEDDLTDLRNQVYDLATGLKLKFVRLRWAGWLFTAQFILFIPLLITLIYNLKKTP